MKMMKMMKMARRWHEDRTIGLSVYRQAQAHCCEERCQPQASPGQSCSASLRNSLSFRCRFVVVVCCVLCVANGYCYKNEPRRKKTDTGSEKLQRTSGEKVRDGTNMEKNQGSQGMKQFPPSRRNHTWLNLVVANCSVLCVGVKQRIFNIIKKVMSHSLQLQSLKKNKTYNYNIFAFYEVYVRVHSHMKKKHRHFDFVEVM